MLNQLSAVRRQDTDALRFAENLKVFGQLDPLEEFSLDVSCLFLKLLDNCRANIPRFTPPVAMAVQAFETGW
jgi:hypothetical protein